MDTLKLYFSLTKPGVLFGNAITTVAGFLFASGTSPDFGDLIFLFLGTSLVIGSACATNNVLDRDIDQKMARTQQRAMAAGRISTSSGFLLAAGLGLAGFGILLAFTNWLVVASGVIGWIVYVWLYGAWSKRQSTHGTLVGAVSGAMPIAAGYLAVLPRLDLAVGLLFISLTVWQLPEFYSIGIYRRAEYAAAKVPILPVVHGVDRAQRDIFWATIMFVLSSCALAFVGPVGYVYLATMLALGLYWLWLGWQGLRTHDSDAWARRMFKFSLVILLAYCLILSIGPWLP